MKKVFAVLTALLPAVYLVSIGLSAVYGAEDEALFTILGLLLVIGFLLPVWFAFLAARADKKFLAVCNIWFYSGNLLLFALEIALWVHRFIENRIAEQNGAWEGGLVLVLLILLYLPHWINYLVVRIVGAVSTGRILSGICEKRTRANLTDLQLLPVADLISAILVLRKVKAFQGCQQPAAEPR